MHKIDCHRVGRAERTAQRIGTRGCETGKRARVEPVVPHDDCVAFVVDAASSCSTRELRVLPRRDFRVCLTVPLRQPLEHHRSRRHVDAESQGFGSEHGLQEALLEEVLDDLLEARDQTRVMCGDPALQCREPFLVAEREQIVTGKVARTLLRIFGDVSTLLRRCQSQPRIQALADGLVATRAGKDESDRRK